MATKAARTRLTREYKTMQKEPTPYIVAHPCETNILEYVHPPTLSYLCGLQVWRRLDVTDRISQSGGTT